MARWHPHVGGEAARLPTKLAYQNRERKRERERERERERDGVRERMRERCGRTAFVLFIHFAN